ncbi:MAG TPA: hypothetical protein VJS92_00770 [Candidatus Polarisedimenticolaceae bacterium]|nr:hypothetical protein [Candidatus Polarisedimenticolaceae bacterium]
MHTGRTRVLALVSVLAAALLSAQASLLSKEYVFKAGTLLEMGTVNDDGVRLDAVQFDLPKSGFLGTGVGGTMNAHVAVTNSGQLTRRVGLGIALFDDGGNLVGVASGGTRLMAIKPGQQRFYTLDFDGLRTEAHKATKFRITLETR